MVTPPVGENDGKNISRLSPRLCHATRDDISIAGFPPTGENDGLGDFCKNDELSPGMAGQLYSRAAEQDARAEQRRNNKQPSFSPLLFVIFAEGGNDEQ